MPATNREPHIKSRVRRDLFDRRLSKLLRIVRDQYLILAAWAVRTLQSDSPERAERFIAYPPDAKTPDLDAPYAVHPWKLETLVNESLARPKMEQAAKLLNMTQFGNIAKLINALRGLEDAEDSFVLSRVSVLLEMHRLGQRQFEWQRGFISKLQLYRAAFIYGGTDTPNSFESRFHFTISDFMLIAFALRTMWSQGPIVREVPNLPIVGLSSDIASKVLKHISVSLPEARRRALILRDGAGHVGYKPSLLRQMPCFVIPDRSGDAYYAPLIDLVMHRATSGLFYDFVGQRGSIRNEISSRFETYSREFFRNSISSYSIVTEFEYRFGSQSVRSPDFFLRKADGSFAVIVECKARRMSHVARFSENPLVEAEDGYAELVKGVLQIWRFKSRVRRRLVDCRNSDDVIGIVLTLDTWLTTSSTMQDTILTRASSAVTGADEIIDVDKDKIAFISNEDLEQTLIQCSDESLMQSLRRLCSPDRRGWHLWSVHGEVAPDVSIDKPFPFESEWNGVVPWWPSHVPV